MHQSLGFFPGQPACRPGSWLWTTLPKGASARRLQQRMELPRRAPEMWRRRWNPLFCCVPSCPSWNLALSPSPPPISFSPVRQMPSVWVAVVVTWVCPLETVDGEFPFLSSPCFSLDPPPPPMCLSPCAVWQQHLLVEGLVLTWETSFEHQTWFASFCPRQKASFSAALK